MFKKVIWFLLAVLVLSVFCWLLFNCSQPPVVTPTVVVPTKTFTKVPTATFTPTRTVIVPSPTFTRRPTATPITPTATITRHPTATKTPTATPKKLYWNWCLQMVVDYPPYRMDNCKIKD